MEFIDCYGLVAKVIEYEELLKDESQQRKTSMGTYYQEVNFEDIAVVDLPSTGSFICPLLMKKAPDLWKKSYTSNLKAQYTFDVVKTREIFYFLLKEKFITFPQDHQLPNKEELKGKVYCKYHNSWNHGTNSCWSFRSIIQDWINKGILKFPEKKETMVIDEDPFLLVASVNIAATDLRVVLNEKKDKKFSPNVKIRKVWIPEQYPIHKDELAVEGNMSIAREKGKNGRYPHNSKQEIKKETPSKEKNVFPKERHTFPKGKNMNASRRKITPRFFVPLLVPLEQKWHVVQHKKFLQKLARTQKRRM